MRVLVAPDPPLEEGPARLRFLEDRDIPVFARALTDPGVFDLAYSGQLPADEDVVRDYVVAFREKAASGEGILLTIASAESDEMAGLAMLFAIKERNLDAEIGFWLGPWARGAGIGTTGVRLIARWAFRHMGLERVHANTAPTNAGARGLLERAGFSFDGTLRGAERTASGERRDLVTYCLLSSDEGAPR